MKAFELWLDESGDFKNEIQKKTRHQNPSLIGGILIEKERANNIDFRNIIDDSLNHATEMDNSTKERYVLPILETFAAPPFNARQIFFENAAFEDMENNKQLYLRMMAEGLLQLLVRLNSLYESVSLDVLIARRQYVTDANRTAIAEEEYISSLEECIQKKVSEHKILLNPDSQLNFRVDIANRTHKLMIADFACNTRLTRDSNAYANVRDRVYNLYSEAYIFSMHEVTSETYYRCCLVQNAFSDALVDLFTTKDNVPIKAMINELMDKFSTTSYRIIKSQLRQFTTEMIAIASRESDFEMLEKLLKNIINNLIKRLKKEKYPYQYLEFNALLLLADAYLREGDISEARETLKLCRQSQYDMGNHLEDIFTYYQLIEKETLYYIDSFQYKEAADLMGRAEESFNLYMDTIRTDSNMRVRFPKLSSEYYGDALCMDIYALMFLQRFRPELYGKMTELSDIAMEQYPNHEGELERHRQYRCHIELEAGNYKEAMQYLMQAKVYTWEDPDAENVTEFLNIVCESEEEVSCQYYLMYYLLVTAEAVTAKSDYGKEYWNILNKQSGLLRKVGLIKNEENDYIKIDLTNAKKKSTYLEYHPLEIVYWKYAYIKEQLTGTGAERYYDKAVSICEKFDNYLTMRVTGLGIRADYAAYMLRTKRLDKYNDNINRARQTGDILRKMELDSGTMEYINALLSGYEEIENQAVVMQKNDVTSSDEETIKVFRGIARKITY